MSSDSVVGDARRRLVEIDDAVRALPDDAFAAKYELLSEADTLRAIVAEQSTPTEMATLKMWASRAGRKDSHTLDYDAEQALAAVIRLGEGGAK